MDMTTSRFRWLRLPTVLATIGIVAAACGNPSGGTTPTASSGQKGGTLLMLGQSDVDALDTASAYYTGDYIFERAYSRQLVTYPTSSTSTTIVADAATQVPTQSNGGISSDGKTYTFKIKSGVKWDTSPARQVTAQDFVLGFKRLCNPANPVGAPGYYENTIAGFKDYCEPFLKQTDQSATAIANYINTNNISGISTSGSDTIKFQLTQAASDFLNILALPFASAAPQEYLQYVPGSNTFNQHVISNGPYSITKYDPGKEIDLARNPAWSSSTDSVRPAYVDAVKLTEGNDPSAIQQQLAAGTADMQFDTPVPTADIGQLLQSRDPRLVVGTPTSVNPYLVFNYQSPNNGGALGKNLQLRQAVEYAINKVAVAKNYGGVSINKPAHQVLWPGNAGYQAFNLYPSPNDSGDAAKAKSLLASAGYPNGITLKMVYRTSGVHPQNFQAEQAALALAGITVRGTPVPGSQYYTRYLENVDAAKSGLWDIADPGWIPDWFGNNGRSIFEPLFDGRTYGPGSTDYGDYNSDAVNSDIDKALAATSTADANKYWHAADMQIMQDAAIVPIINQQTAVFHSSRVQNAVFFPFSQQFDITSVWLKSGS
jgi:peptide/nickel transport system substrate-binding protein